MAKRVSEEDVKKIAGLSRLRLEGDELKKLTADFNEILKFVEQIEEVDVTGASQISHVLNKTNVGRDDQVVPGVQRSAIELMSHNFIDGFFVVPRVIEEEK